MNPWERRLRDLSQLLRTCGETYFSPDRFRQNTNQFLQTSRTVTFIIQKNKAQIPNFDSWYKINVLQPWASDPVMSWAKDSRNVIEKEGDLEMQSTLQVAILFSYESEEDMVIEVGRRELLQGSVEQLLKVAHRMLPPGVIDAAVLKIQRRWVANTLPDRELIYALTYTYAQIFQVCEALASHLGTTFDSSIPHPTEADPATNDVAKIRFMKLSKPVVGRRASMRIKADPSFKPTPALLRLQEEFQSTAKPSSLADVVAKHAKMAQLTFEQYGNHIPMLALYDKNWNHIDFMSTAFSDQAEKFLFWRDAADRAFYLKAYAMVWTSESWVRDLKGREDSPISKLPIIGEQLHVIGADASGAQQVATWNIARTAGTKTPTLVSVDPENKSGQPGLLNFIKPIVAAMKKAHASSTG